MVTPQLCAVGLCQPHSLIGSRYLHNKNYNYIVELNTNLAKYGPPPCLYIWMDCFHTLKKTFWRSYGFAMSPARTKTFSRGLKNKQYDMCARVLVEIRPNLPWAFLTHSDLPAVHQTQKCQADPTVSICKATSQLSYVPLLAQFTMVDPVNFCSHLIYYYYYFVISLLLLFFLLVILLLY